MIKVIYSTTYMYVHEDGHWSAIDGHPQTKLI